MFIRARDLVATFRDLFVNLKDFFVIFNPTNKININDHFLLFINNISWGGGEDFGHLLSCPPALSHSKVIVSSFGSI